MLRVAARIELTEAERKELERRERAHSTPDRDRQASQSDSVSERRFGESTDRGQTEVKSYGGGQVARALQRGTNSRIGRCAWTRKAEQLGTRADGSSFKPGSATSGSFATLELPHHGSRIGAESVDGAEAVRPD